MEMDFPDNSFDGLYALESTLHATTPLAVYSEVGIYTMAVYSEVGIYTMAVYSEVGIYTMAVYSEVGIYTMRRM